jgi:phospholipid transport system substrate-binding protein
MRPLLRTALACTLLVLLAATRQALAGVPTDQLRMQVDRVLKLLDDPALKAPDKANERRVAVRKVAEDIFDFGETAKRSLGRHWAARTPQERDEFTKLFGDLLERSYISKIELYGGEKIQYVGDRIEGDTAIVQSKLLTKSGGWSTTW